MVLTNMAVHTNNTSIQKEEAREYWDWGYPSATWSDNILVLLKSLDPWGGGALI